MASGAQDGRLRCDACGAIIPPDAKFCGKCGESVGATGVQPGDVIADRYRIVAEIGRGAMGVVYRAEHVQISKLMAIKLLHREVEDDPQNVARFQREAEAASRLDHPNTVQVFDFGRTDAGSLYLTMEYVDGRDLGKIIAQEGTIPFGRVAYLCAQVAGSIADAHAAGVIHRDLKPENIVITEGRDGERPRVLDFGLAKLFEGKVGTQITSSGTIVGTPYYMSPEQIQGQELDPRSDVYAMGAIMYECVVGEPLFDAPNAVGILSKHLSEPAKPPSTRSPASVPPEADEIILRCLEKAPELRYQTAEELREALVDYLTAVGSEDWKITAGGSGASKSGARRVDDLDGVLRRERGPWLWLALAGLVAGGFVAWQGFGRGPSEGEPNHLPSEATRLPPDSEMEAYLGKRLDEGSGDVDLFSVRHEGPERAAEIEVSSIPNMDVVVELLEPGVAEPILVADSRGLGQGERLPNAPIPAGVSLIRIRERPVEGRLPTENVSDPYYVRWNPIPNDPEYEQELNDSLERAEPLALDTERRAWIGWPGDVDSFCLSEAADSVIAQVSALSEVDLVLRVVDRRSERSQKVDEKGPGRGETSKTWRNAEAGQLCIEISADPSDERGRAAQPDATYGVRFIRAPKP